MKDTAGKSSVFKADIIINSENCLNCFLNYTKFRNDLLSICQVNKQCSTLQLFFLISSVPIEIKNFAVIKGTSSSDITQANSLGIKLSATQLQGYSKNSFQIFKYFWIDEQEMMFLLWEIMLLDLYGQELETAAVFFPLLLLITNKKLS